MAAAAAAPLAFGFGPPPPPTPLACPELALPAFDSAAAEAVVEPLLLLLVLLPSVVAAAELALLTVVGAVETLDENGDDEAADEVDPVVAPAESVGAVVGVASFFRTSVRISSKRSLIFCTEPFRLFSRFLAFCSFSV